MEKTLVLIDNLYKQYGLNGEEKNSIRFLPMLRKEESNRLTRIVRKLHLSSFLPLKEIWIGPWKKCIEEYDTIILGDAGNTFNVVKYIHNNWPDKRIIVWYRNSVVSTFKPTKIDRLLCELWSFDKNDCTQYNMRYNPQFYMRNSHYTEKNPEFDAFFVGQDKGRIEILSEIEEKLKENGIQSKFCIVGKNSCRLSYDEILENISKCKMIIDCQCDWQEGITLRPLEALFYEKKLLTNNPKIIEYDFYNSNNIFIWGKDKLSDLQEFLHKPYVKIPEKTVNKYGLGGWIERFYT